MGASSSHTWDFETLIFWLRSPTHILMFQADCGKDFYLSNTWYQEVPPGAGRLGYHKDARGSITITILMNDHGPRTGNTCLVPGTHINTPPASYCMANPHSAHSTEVDLVGNAGDILCFAPETWHARSEHKGSNRTRRSYNFYSRSSRSTTTWAGVVDPAIIEQARASLPTEYGHMFEIDARRSLALATVQGPRIKSWAYGKSSSEEILRDIVFAAYAYGRTPENLRETGALLPFTTRLTEARAYSAIEYFSKLKIIPTLKSIHISARDFETSTG